MTLKNNPASRWENLVVQEINRETLVYDLKTNKVFCLNETSGLIWRLCDGTKSVAEISQLISKQLESPVTEEFVWLALDKMKNENLLANGAELNINFNGLSRREVIKKAGYATVIALPLITSLTAPTAAQAQSASAPVITVCNTAAGCCPGNSQIGGNSEISGANCLDNARANCCSGDGTQNGPIGNFFGTFNCSVICTSA